MITGSYLLLPVTLQLFSLKSEQMAQQKAAFLKYGTTKRHRGYRAVAELHKLMKLMIKCVKMFSNRLLIRQMGMRSRLKLDQKKTDVFKHVAVESE